MERSVARITWHRLRQMVRVFRLGGTTLLMLSEQGVICHNEGTIYNLEPCAGVLIFPTGKPVLMDRIESRSEKLDVL
ncbi:MAG: hypothetical protein QGG48_13045, partial [Desulfatiglandales bacterium]|nr:hypothetical protein [Desulfatiglandales bacterium]